MSSFPSYFILVDLDLLCLNGMFLIIQNEGLLNYLVYYSQIFIVSMEIHKKEIFLPNLIIVFHSELENNSLIIIILFFLYRYSIFHQINLKEQFIFTNLIYFNLLIQFSFLISYWFLFKNSNHFLNLYW